MTISVSRKAFSGHSADAAPGSLENAFILRRLMDDSLADHKVGH